ncbi:GAF domain-containing protein [Streptomyces pathocidini]|uniref:GAF domain-containing protein n=1 Tax=Streptomyces pathocidini TaxID=1650571 RepID=A0ABW7UMK8_9ACTN|nr:helix-turn-helix domain-containing protein [Streptomyces pathocidini]
MTDEPLDLARLSAMEPGRATRLLSGVRAAAFAGRQPRLAPRKVIHDSWQRVRLHGLDPEQGAHAGLLGLDEVEHRRRSSPLGTVLPTLREGLMAAAEEAWHMMVVTDAEGRVLWREGNQSVLRKADQLGFGVGASWAEETAGTNAVGTSLVVRGPVQVHSAEHFVRAYHPLSCCAAPVLDPRDGRLIGIANLTGPAPAITPATLALVTAVAKLAEGELRERHRESVDRLRSVAAPVLARVGGRALAVDRNGWTAAVTGMLPPDRVPLPKSFQAGRCWLPPLGVCTVEPLPEGWLLRLDDEGPDGAEQRAEPSRVVLDLRRPRQPGLSVAGAAGRWAQELTPRHAELLYVLARHPEGRTAAQLAEDLFGDPARTVTVRAELSRIRRTLGGVLDHRPYRFADRVRVELLTPPDAAQLLPHSTAPALLAARATPSPRPTKPVTGQPN